MPKNRKFTVAPLRWNADQGNCFLWGCVTIVLVFILGSIVAGLTLRYGIQQFREQYSDDAPIDLPRVAMTSEQIDTLLLRVQAFEDGLEADQPPDPLTLTQDELNAVLQNHPDLIFIGDNAHFAIEDDKLIGQLSISLDFLPGFAGRFFNGSAVFSIAMEHGRLSVLLDSAIVKGQPVPENVMQGWHGENIAEDLHDNPRAGKLIKKIEAIDIKGGVITITPSRLKEEHDLQEAVDTASPA